MEFQPSQYSIQNPSEATCDKASADKEKYYKLMWKTPVLTPKRVEYEKKTNAAGKVVKACKKAGVGGRSAGFPKDSIPNIWKSDPKKRKVEGGLVVSAALTGPDVLDMINSAVKGFNPTLLLVLEYRAEIAGGLATLATAGVPGFEGIDPKALQKYVAATLSKKDNAVLLKLAGETGDDDKALAAAAKKMRSRIAKMGDAAMNHAFAARGLYMLSAGAVANVGKSVGLIALAFVPVVGTALSLVLGAKQAIAIAISESVKKKLQDLAQQSVEKMQAQVAEEQATAEAKMAEDMAKAQADLNAANAKQAGASASGDALPTMSIEKMLLSGVAALALLGAVAVYIQSRGSDE